MRKEGWIRWLAGMLLLGLTVPVMAAQGDGSRVLDLSVAGAGAQRALYVSPSHPKATLVMLPGGAGDIGIGNDGSLAHGHNFLVRSRDLWVAHGFAVLIPDAVGGIKNLRGLRSTPEYAAVVTALVKAARAQAAAPVFLMGTSQGSIAAVNGAAHLRGGEIAAVVLTESVSRLGGSHETVFSAHPDRINVPVLIVANSDDRCKVAPPQEAPKIAAAMTGAPLVKVLDVSGGVMHGTNACGSLSPHGYDGIEPHVVDAIAAWLRARL